MAIFIPSDTVLHYKTVAFTLYGEAVTARPRPVRVNIVAFNSTAKITQIRAEASASHARVEEQDGGAVVHFPPGYVIKMDDRVDVLGATMTVINIYPRSDLFGEEQYIIVTLTRLMVPVPEVS